MSATALINAANLRNNYRIIRNRVKPSVDVICVVKANAYGHGIDIAAPALYDEGARFFAVANIDEAVELRRILPDCEILVLGYTAPDASRLLIDNNIIQTVYSADYARSFYPATKTADKKIRAHLKVDSGMNRLGFKNPAEIPADSDKYFDYEGIFTHFSCADAAESTNESDFTNLQLKCFTDFIGDSKREFKIKHAANSAAILRYPATHLDAVRLGVILYGLKLGVEPDICDIGMKPVMTLHTVVSHVHTIESGESVGYGAEFTADKKMKIATLAVGYADGFIRAYKKSAVTIKGQQFPIIGRICMDQCSVDISDADFDVKIGDDVFLFGDNAQIKAENLADFASTINYETTCQITARVKRISID
jgi:alanine racemase